MSIQGLAVDLGAYEFTGTNNGNPSGADLLAINTDVASAAISGRTTLAAATSVCRQVATILPNGNPAVSGTVHAKVFIDAAIQFYPYNGQLLLYLQRHYEITPEANAANATAQLTLYYTQAEFNAYNSQAVADGRTLPTSANDAEGKRRLRILQYHGTSSDGSGSPTSYTGTTTLITPDEDKIVWNGGLKRWEITFNITGFSGFFLGVDPLVVLPIKLVSFTGHLTSNEKAASLQWQVAAQQGIQQYIVERGVDGNSFQSIGCMAANQLSPSTYTYEDILPSQLMAHNPLYYRLKIIDVGGTTSYSAIVRLNLQSPMADKITLYPNPVSKASLLKISIINGFLRQYKLTTASGQVLLHKKGLHVTGTTSLQLPASVAAGVYYLQLQTDKGMSNERVVVK